MGDALRLLLQRAARRHVASVDSIQSGVLQYKSTRPDGDTMAASAIPMPMMWRRGTHAAAAYQQMRGDEDHAGKPC
jgi:hypothetical protein